GYFLRRGVYSWSPSKKTWIKLPFALPSGTTFADDFGDRGLRFVDLDGDGYDDILFSNEDGYAIYLFTNMKEGWSRKVKAGKRSDPDAVPMISRNGTNNGAWFHLRHLIVQNEDTAKKPDLIDRRSFNELLDPSEPAAKSPRASLRSIQ